MKCPYCDSEFDSNGSSRSVPQLRRYFVMIRAAYYNWPETHDRQFADEHECRKFLQMAAGHRIHAASIPLIGMRKEHALIIAEAAIKAAGNYAHVVFDERTKNVVIWKPKSISFHKLKHRDACQLFDQVSSQIREHVGIDGDELLKQSERAA